MRCRKTPHALPLGARFAQRDCLPTCSEARPGFENASQPGRRQVSCESGGDLVPGKPAVGQRSPSVQSANRPQRGARLNGNPTWSCSQLPRRPRVRTPLPRAEGKAHPLHPAPGCGKSTIKAQVGCVSLFPRVSVNSRCHCQLLSLRVTREAYSFFE